MEAPLDTNAPPGQGRAQLQADAPAVAALLDAAPNARIYTRSSPYYQHLRDYYCKGLVAQPLALIRPQTEYDVCAVVRFCSSRAIPFAIRSGGHDLHGRSLAGDSSTMSSDSGLDSVVLDMRSISSAAVESDKSVARVGGGILSAALLTALESHGVFTPTPWADSVGYVPWALGGGYGMFATQYGLGVDQILGARVVLASGQVVDTDDDQELLWALRGAGCGSFGIVTELRVKVYPIPRMIAGDVTMRLAEAETAFARYQQLREAGECQDISGEAFAIHLPGAEPLMAWRFCYISKDGDIAPGWAQLEKMKSTGSIIDVAVLAGEVKETTPAASILAGTPSSWFSSTRNIRTLSAEFGRIIRENLPPAFGSILVHDGTAPPGGPPAYPDGAGSCFGSRFPHLCVIFIGGMGIADADAPELVLLRNWVAKMDTAVTQTPSLAPGGYGGFASPSQVELVSFFGTEAAERLRALKKRLDPEICSELDGRVLVKRQAISALSVVAYAKYKMLRARPVARIWVQCQVTRII